MTLLAIVNDKTMESSIRVVTKSYMENLCKYENILTSHIFMRLFRETKIIWIYLQTSGLDLLTAKRLISQTSTNIEKMSRDFETVKCAADNFVQWTKQQLQTYDSDETDSISIEDKLPEKRNQANVLSAFKIEVFNVIMDTTLVLYNHRFNEDTQELIQNLSCLDPPSFSPLSEKGLPEHAMTKPAEALKTFDLNVSKSKLKDEIIDLAKN